MNGPIKTLPDELLPEGLENVVDLEAWKTKPKPKPAGKEPPSGKDWLSSLQSGTEFLVRDIHGVLTPRWLVLEWIFGGLHPTKNVLLIPGKTPNEPKTWQWVDPAAFCQAFEFRGIIYIPTQEDYDKADKEYENNLS